MIRRLTTILTLALIFGIIEAVKYPKVSNSTPSIKKVLDFNKSIQKNPNGTVFDFSNATQLPSSSSTARPTTITTTLATTTVTEKLNPLSEKCLKAVTTCYFDEWPTINSSSITSFCDHSLYEGKKCMEIQTKQIGFTLRNSSKPSYFLLECARVFGNSSSSLVSTYAWSFLSYCIYNSPQNSAKPRCFDAIQQSCSIPSSSDCISACEFPEKTTTIASDNPTTAAASSSIILPVLILVFILKQTIW